MTTKEEITAWAKSKKSKELQKTKATEVVQNLLKPPKPPKKTVDFLVSCNNFIRTI